MIYKLLKANYVNKNNVSYSEECIDKIIEQYKDKKFNVYCANEIDVLEYNTSDYYKNKTIFGEISNLRKEDDYLICDLEFDKNKLKKCHYDKFYLDSIYSAEPTYEDDIGKINECKIMVHFFQEFNDEHKPASEFREIINLE